MHPSPFPSPVVDLVEVTTPGRLFYKGPHRGATRGRSAETTPPADQKGRPRVNLLRICALSHSTPGQTVVGAGVLYSGDMDELRRHLVKSKASLAISSTCAMWRRPTDTPQQAYGTKGRTSDEPIVPKADSASGCHPSSPDPGSLLKTPSKRKHGARPSDPTAPCMPPQTRTSPPKGQHSSHRTNAAPNPQSSAPRNPKIPRETHPVEGTQPDLPAPHAPSPFAARGNNPNSLPGSISPPHPRCGVTNVWSPIHYSITPLRTKDMLTKKERRKGEDRQGKRDVGGRQEAPTRPAKASRAGTSKLNVPVFPVPCPPFSLAGRTWRAGRPNILGGPRRGDKEGVFFFPP